MVDRAVGSGMSHAKHDDVDASRTLLTKQHFTSTESSSHDKDSTPEVNPEVDLHIEIIVGSATEAGEGTIEVPDHIANNFDKALTKRITDDYTGPDFTATLSFEKSARILGAFPVLHDCGGLFRMWARPSSMEHGRVDFRHCIVTDMKSATDDRTGEDVVKVDVAVEHAW